MIEDWLEQNIDDTLKYTGNGREVHFSCPICDETRHRMYVNLETGAVYCHNCNWSGNIIKLIQYVEGISWTKARDTYKDIQGTLYLPSNVMDELERNVFVGDFRNDLAKRAIPLPEEYTVLNPDKPNLRTKRAIKYLNSRKITNKQIKSYKMGFCTSGEYSNRVIIPITENNDLRFWVARAISKEVKLKEKSPSDEDYQISKSEVIFNIDIAAKKYHSCVISEGIFDALSWGSIGVSLLGKVLYQEQLNILLDYKNLLTDGVYIALDYDAKSYATKMAEVLNEYFQVYVINIPEELDDPNNTLQKKGRSYLWKLIEQAEPYSEFSGIRRLFG